MAATDFSDLSQFLKQDCRIFLAVANEVPAWSQPEDEVDGTDVGDADHVPDHLQLLLVVRDPPLHPALQVVPWAVDESVDLVVLRREKGGNMKMC